MRDILNRITDINAIYIYRGILFMFIVFAVSSCSIASLMHDTVDPNRHEVKDLSKLYAVREGMSRQEVLAIWGEPFRKTAEDQWIYYFPELVDQKIYLTFNKNNLIKMESSPKDWWWF